MNKEVVTAFFVLSASLYLTSCSRGDTAHTTTTYPNNLLTSKLLLCHIKYWYHDHDIDDLKCRSAKAHYNRSFIFICKECFKGQEIKGCSSTVMGKVKVLCL